MPQGRWITPPPPEKLFAFIPGFTREGEVAFTIVGFSPEVLFKSDENYEYGAGIGKSSLIGRSNDFHQSIFNAHILYICVYTKWAM